LRFLYPVLPREWALNSKRSSSRLVSPWPAQWFAASHGHSHPSPPSPPRCAPYGNWTHPQHRAAPDANRCEALGCLGHLTLPRLRLAFGDALLERTYTIALLRDPVDLFVSEYHYIRAELEKAVPSLQFVQDQALLGRMRGGMSLADYVAFPHKSHDWHGCAVNRQAFYLTNIGTDEMRKEPRKAAAKAINALRGVDFVGLMEDMPKAAAMLRCVLGVPELEIAKLNVGKYPTPTNATLLGLVRKRLEIDLEVYAFAKELFKVRWGNMGVMAGGYEHCHGLA